MKVEDMELIYREKKLIPVNIPQFKCSRIYTVPSLLKKFEWFLPTAKPLGKYNGNYILHP